MRLADYVVSYSLEINNRCLRYLAECDARTGVVSAGETNDTFSGELHTVYAESLLARDSRRLTSMWSLMQPGWKDTDPRVALHVGAFTNAARALTSASSSHRLALRLASLASEDQEAEAILKVARKLPSEVALTWDALNELFAADSLHWRGSMSFRHLEDDVLQQRVVRSYRRGYRLGAEIPSEDAPEWLRGHAQKFYNWVQLSTHQLELLRPGLSDKGRAQLWYLDKMSDTLRTRAGLEDLRAAAREVRVKKAASKMVQKYIDQQIQKMDKRVVRLAEGCFTSKPNRLGSMIAHSVDALGLTAVSLMKNSTAGQPTTTSTENAYG